MTCSFGDLRISMKMTEFRFWVDRENFERLNLKFCLRKIGRYRIRQKFIE